MTTKQEAKKKINAAAAGCEIAQVEWRAAGVALDGSVSVNGYGVHHRFFSPRNLALQGGE